MFFRYIKEVDNLFLKIYSILYLASQASQMNETPIFLSTINDLCYIRFQIQLKMSQNFQQSFEKKLCSYCFTVFCYVKKEKSCN